MTIAAGSRVALRRTAPQDAARAFRWLTASDLTATSMGAPWFHDRPAPTREQFQQRFPAFYFDGTHPFDGRALLLQTPTADVGILVWHRIDLLRDLTELDIWLASGEYARRGIGSESLELICHWLQTHYGANRFVLRPSRRNVRALRSARRAGFRETDLEPHEVEQRLRLPASPYRDAALLFRVLPQVSTRLASRPDDLCVFVDTEFSSLEAPVLLSVGAATDAGDTFYAELPREGIAMSSFVEQRVLPLMQGTAAPREAVRTRFLDWLEQCADGRRVHLVSDSGFDRWALSDLLGSERLPDAVQWQRVPVTYAQLDHVCEELHLRRHHALDDALALRYAVLGPSVHSAAGLQGSETKLASQPI